MFDLQNTLTDVSEMLTASIIRAPAQTKRRNIPEDSHFYTRRHGNLKYHHG
jgi:hypothetical protein